MTISDVFIIACVILWICSAAFTIWYTFNSLWKGLFDSEEETTDAEDE